MVKAWCRVVGAYEGDAFSVKVNENIDVEDFKEKLKLRKPNVLQNVDIDNIFVFLAKRNGSWLTVADAAAVALNEHGYPEGFAKMNPSLPIYDSENFGSPFQPSPNEIHVLVVLMGVSAPETERKRKRMEENAAPDAWIKALKDEQVEMLPSTSGDLKVFLERELRTKVPIDDVIFDMVSAVNLTGESTSHFYKLFEPEPRRKLSFRTAIIVGSVVEPPWSGAQNANEETYHHLWDSLIAFLLKRVASGHFRRNSNVSTSTGLCRPDLCFYYKNSNVCVFRGEEKGEGSMEVPLKELHEKLTWRYDSAPYVFGYAAVGQEVCLVTIRKDEMTERGAKVEIIETYNLGELNDRLSFFLALLNLSTLFRPVVNLIQPLDMPEYGIIERLNGVKITFAEDCVVKTYPPHMPSDIIIHNLGNLYRMMKSHSVPNVVELKRTNMKKKQVKLAPVGRLSPPENIHQLLIALHNILQALVALHAINIMHRDLRWENVLKYPDEDKWFIIDFDDGASSPAAKVSHLKAESHAPEILSSTSHTVEVDIWSVGFLLKTATFQGLPPELESIKAQCLQENPSERPTAESLLTSIESLLDSW